MAPELVGLLGILFLLVLLLMGIPVSFSLLIAGVLGTTAIAGFYGALSMIASIAYYEIASYSFVVLPMFIFMGEFTEISGVGKGIFETSNKWVGRIPGGLAISTTAGCALFAALSGSSIGATTLFGKVALPEMRRYGYDDKLSCGCIAASGTFAAMIPPSGIMVIYCIFTQASLGRLMIAGIIPGIVSALIYIGMILVRVYLDPSLGPPSLEKISWKEKILSLKWVLPIGVIICVTLGGIYFGIFTPTEAGAIGAFCTFIMALIRKTVGQGRLRTTIMDAGQTCVMIFLIIVGSLVFGRFLNISEVTFAFSDFVLGSGFTPLGIVVAILFLYLILGFFVPGGAVLAMTLPVLLPLLLTTGIDLIWFGILCIKTVEIAAITPPMAVNIYALKAVGGESLLLETIIRGIIPFSFMDILTLAVLVLWPEISLWLPRTMF